MWSLLAACRQTRIQLQHRSESAPVRVVIASFTDVRCALRMPGLLSAEFARSEAALRARVHDGEVDPLLSMDLSGSAVDGADHIMTRFGLVFALGLGLGLAVDLAIGIQQTGFSFSAMGVGLGVVIGTMLVLLAAPSERDRAFDEAQAAVERGDVLVSVRIDPAHQRDAAVDLLRRNGGRLVLEA